MISKAYKKEANKTAHKLAKAAIHMPLEQV
jgi:hypothetical protein